MDIKFYEKLLKVIREKRSSYAERLLNGTFKTLEEYKLIVGKWKGLEEAELLLIDLFKGTYSTDIGDRDDGKFEMVI